MATYDNRLIAERYSANAGHPPRLGPEAERERGAVIAKIANGDYVCDDRPCAICGGTAFEILAERDRYNFPIRTAICKNCGLIQSDPIFRASDYQDFYTHHYRKLYLAELVGEPADFFREEYWRGQRIARYTQRCASIPKGGLVVEIGCGAGGILSAFSALGYRVIGTDFGADNLAYGRSKGLDLRTGSLHSLELAERPALIVYSHVLEHVCDLDRELERVREILAEDGYFYIEVPGVKDVHRNLFQADFLRTFHLAHIYNFTLTTMANLLAKHGFESVAGDETIRAVFRRGTSTAPARSDYADTLEYIASTERRRKLYALRFRLRSRIRGIAERIRTATIGALHRLGLYERVRDLAHRVRH